MHSIKAGHSPPVNLHDLRGALVDRLVLWAVVLFVVGICRLLGLDLANNVRSVTNPLSFEACLEVGQSSTPHEVRYDGSIWVGVVLHPRLRIESMYRFMYDWLLK